MRVMMLLMLQEGATGSPRSPGGSQAVARSQRALVMALSAAGLYGAAAISMNFVNKASLHVYPLPNALLLLQMVATLLVLAPLQVGVGLECRAVTLKCASGEQFIAFIRLQICTRYPGYMYLACWSLSCWTISAGGVLS